MALGLVGIATPALTTVRRLYFLSSFSTVMRPKDVLTIASVG
jgi:hypothetical protein